MVVAYGSGDRSRVDPAAVGCSSVGMTGRRSGCPTVSHRRAAAGGRCGRARTSPSRYPITFTPPVAGSSRRGFDAQADGSSGANSRDRCSGMPDTAEPTRRTGVRPSSLGSAKAACRSGRLLVERPEVARCSAEARRIGRVQPVEERPVPSGHERIGRQLPSPASQCRDTRRAHGSDDGVDAETSGEDEVAGRWLPHGHGRLDHRTELGRVAQAPERPVDEAGIEQPRAAVGRTPRGRRTRRSSGPPSGSGRHVETPAPSSSISSAPNVAAARSSTLPGGETSVSARCSITNSRNGSCARPCDQEPGMKPAEIERIGRRSVGAVHGA